MYTIGGVEMKYPLIIGAGACKTPESILPYMRSDIPIGAVSTGSYTPNGGLGNTGTLFHPLSFSEFIRDGIGLNSFGMPNMGYNQAAAELRRYTVLLPIIASVAGSSSEDFAAGIRAFHDVPCVAAIKLNVGCPNKAERPVPIAYDLVFLSQIFETVEKVIRELGTEKPIWLKLSPYITIEQRNILQALYPHIDFSNVPVVEPEFLGKISNLIWDYEEEKLINAIIFSNTLPGVIIRSKIGKPVTTPNDGRAGLSGKILKPISNDLIRQAAMMLPSDVDLIHSGGNLNGDDVVDALENGASAACCTSGPFWSGNGPRFSANLLSGSERLQNYLLQHSQQED